jgi:AcrR family transcriptional regulator
MQKVVGKTTTKVHSRGRGRPRSDEAHQSILHAAYELLMEVGYTQLTIEEVAARALVGKPTIYRRWSSKARLVMDAFLAATNSELSFPDTGSVKEDILQQMHKLVKILNTPRGQVIATLIGGGQTDPEIISAFQANWLSPRRFDCSQVIKKGIERGELRSDIDIEAVIDALYSPLFYRLLLKHAPLTEDFVDELIDIVMPGLDGYPKL